MDRRLPLLPSGGIAAVGEGASSLVLLRDAGSSAGAAPRWCALVAGEAGVDGDGSSLVVLAPSPDAPLAPAPGAHSNSAWSAACALPGGAAAGGWLVVAGDAASFDVKLLLVAVADDDGGGGGRASSAKVLRTICTARDRVTALAAVALPAAAGAAPALLLCVLARAPPPPPPQAALAPPLPFFGATALPRAAPWRARTARCACWT
jgi:hypothetical protein